MSILSDKRIILGVTGSIAAYKAADVASKLTQANAQVDVILSSAAEKFITPLTLFSFISQFRSQWNLLFADVIVITIPPLIMFMFFQRQIVSGMTAGAIKG